jgi:hypothetical protein
MALTVGEDSYISVADADTHFGNVLYATDWTGATTADKEKALKMGAVTIDSYEHYGTRTDVTGIPKIDGITYNSTDIPEPIELANAEMALVHLKRNITTTTAQQKYKSVDLSSIGAEYRDNIINMETAFVNAQLKGFIKNSSGQAKAIHG